MIPIRIRALLERWISGKKHGRITIIFKDGGIPDLEIVEKVRPENLPPPSLNEPDKVAP